MKNTVVDLFAENYILEKVYLHDYLEQKRYHDIIKTFTEDNLKNLPFRRFQKLTILSDDIYCDMMDYDYPYGSNEDWKLEKKLM